MGMEVWIWRDGHGDAMEMEAKSRRQRAAERVKLFLVPFTKVCLLSLVVDDMSPPKTERSAEKNKKQYGEHKKLLQPEHQVSPESSTYLPPR